jgi:very-short-patch-repair endonuclease
MPAICQLCGKPFGQYITGKHLQREHGVTREEYAEKFGITSLKAPDYLAPIERSEEIRRKVGAGVSRAQRAKGDKHHMKRPEVRAKLRRTAKARASTPEGQAQLDAARQQIDHARIGRIRSQGYEQSPKAKEDHKRAIEASLTTRRYNQAQPGYVHHSKFPEFRAKISAATTQMHREGRLQPIYTLTKPHRDLIAALQEARLYEGFQTEYQLLYFVDEAHPEKRVALEVDGCFWHGCPEHAGCYKKRRAITRTKHERNLAYATGWRIFRFWEHDLQKRMSACVGVVRRALEDPDFVLDLWNVAVAA